MPSRSWTFWVSSWGARSLLFLGLLVVLALIWCLVPFAIFGIKPRLDSMVRAIQEQTRVQRELVREMRSLRERSDDRTSPDSQARTGAARNFLTGGGQSSNRRIQAGTDSSRSGVTEAEIPSSTCSGVVYPQVAW